MKIKELKELKLKDVKELKSILSKKKLELLQNGVKILESKEKNLKVIRNLRKEIAQIMSFINERRGK